MGSIGNYWFFWALYLGAAVIFSGLFWRVTRFEKAIWASYSLRAVAIAVVFTPWYSNSQESGMAPATLDAITGGFEAAFRSSVPLVLAVLFGLLLASVMSFFKKK
jgi:hypothetical protein